MANTNRPQVTADNIGTYSLQFETSPCARCDGTGEHWAGTCYGCGGAKTRLSRAGGNAKARYEETLTELCGLPVENVQPGDQVRAEFHSRHAFMASYPLAWRTVHAVEEEDYEGYSSTLPHPRPRDQHPEDWVKTPPQINLFGFPKNGEYLGVAIGVKGQTVVMGHHLPGIVQAWNAALRLKGSYLVEKETGQEYGRPSQEEKAAQASKNAASRVRSAEKREQREQEKLSTFLTANPTAQKVREFDSGQQDRGTEILRDLRNSLLTYGRLTEPQLTLAEKLLSERTQ